MASPDGFPAGSWTYQGRHQRLKPGSYAWYVWPAFNKSETYRQLIGTASFRVRYARLASTSSACRSGLTRRMIFATLPSASITNVERSYEFLPSCPTP